MAVATTWPCVSRKKKTNTNATSELSCRGSKAGLRVPGGRVGRKSDPHLENFFAGRGGRSEEGLREVQRGWWAMRHRLGPFRQSSARSWMWGRDGGVPRLRLPARKRARCGRNSLPNISVPGLAQGPCPRDTADLGGQAQPGSWTYQAWEKKTFWVLSFSHKLDLNKLHLQAINTIYRSKMDHRWMASKPRGPRREPLFSSAHPPR
jgi:hypothetical protein